MTLVAPARLEPDHQIKHFSCGEPSLDEWLKKRALNNQHSSASKTFVVANSHREVVAYYALALGAVAHEEATRSIRQNMPDPIPVMVLARLAVDVRAQGQKLGSAMLQDALHRCMIVSAHAGIRALLVHALNDKAQAFYQHFGFKSSPIQEKTLMLRLPVKIR